MTGSIPSIVATLTIGALGVLAFSVAGLPLPWLLGPMFGCLAAALLGVKLKGVPMVSNAMRTVLGVAVGASITPALVARLDEMALSIALVPPFVLAIGLAGYPYFRRVCRFDKATSFYAAMPGGLQDMLVFGEEAGGSPRVLSLIHATRVLVVVSVLPLVLSFAMSINLDQPPGQAASSIPSTELILMVALAAAGWAGAARIGLFGASILGPLILAAVASLTGFLNHRPPTEAILAAQFFIGMGVGVKYVGITGQELRRVVGAGLGYCMILAILSFIVAEIVIALGLAPPLEAILAFSPGGQAEMTVLAIVAGADIAFVVTHHLLRIVTVILGAPIFFRYFS
jgi:membrane AbrB-like protein